MPVDSARAHRNPGSDQEFRRGAGAGRPRPDGARKARCTASSGPNGAGKSTTIRILLGLVKADGGTARLLGGDPWTDAVELHRQIAYVPGDVTLWPSLTGGETIDLLARMRGGIDEKRRTELIERFDLDPHKKARTYSKGNRQKVSLISAFSSHAGLLLLDEPSSGLDPLMENVFQQCVGEARDRGVTVLLSSHILAETEALCERVTIIRAGKTVESGSLDSMRHLSRTSIKAEMIGDPRRSHPDQGRRGRQRRRQHAARPGRQRKPRGTHPGARRRRRAQPGQPAADPGGAVPAPLRHRGRHAARGCRRDEHRNPGSATPPAHQAPPRWLELLRNARDAAALPAPRPNRRCRCGCCCCRFRWPPCTSAASRRSTPPRPTAPGSRPPSWPARPSARSTARSTTTALGRWAFGRPGCSTC